MSKLKDWIKDPTGATTGGTEPFKKDSEENKAPSMVGPVIALIVLVVFVGAVILSVSSG